MAVNALVFLEWTSEVLRWHDYAQCDQNTEDALPAHHIAWLLACGTRSLQDVLFQDALTCVEKLSEDHASYTENDLLSLI